MRSNIKLISGNRIKSPLTKKTRPTTSRVREAIINILGRQLEEASWLDLCSGSGAMACEVLHKGVKRVLAIEMHRPTAQICKSNLITISNRLDHLVDVQIINKDIISFLKKGPLNRKIKFFEHSPTAEQRFDFVFLDPPYESDLYKLSQEFLLSKGWIKKSSTLICECSSNIPIAIHNGWKLNKEKIYGNTNIIFLTPNQALNCSFDIDSMH